MWKGEVHYRNYDGDTALVWNGLFEQNQVGVTLFLTRTSKTFIPMHRVIEIRFRKIATQD